MERMGELASLSVAQSLAAWLVSAPKSSDEAQDRETAKKIVEKAREAVRTQEEYGGDGPTNFLRALAGCNPVGGTATLAAVALPLYVRWRWPDTFAPKPLPVPEGVEPYDHLRQFSDRTLLRIWDDTGSDEDAVVAAVQILIYRGWRCREDAWHSPYQDKEADSVNVKL